MNKKNIIIGNYYGVGLVLDSFPKLYDYIHCYIPIDENYGTLNQIPIYSFDILNNNDYKDYNIIISNDNIYEEYSSFIVKEYNINKSNIKKLREWLSFMLKENENIKLMPKSINLDVCTKCQLNCRGCYMRLHNNGVLDSGYTSFSNFKTFIDDNPFIERIEMGCNGEIFLDPDLNDILLYCYEKGITVAMNGGVNFNYVSEDVLKTLVTTQVEEICISIDGATNEVYKKYRRNGDLDKVLNNIKKLNKYKEEFNSEFPILRCQFIVMDDNIHQIEDIKKIASDLNMNMYFKKDWSNTVDDKKKEYIEEHTNLKYSENEDDCYGYCYQTIFSPQINWDGRLLGCVIVYRDDWGTNVFKDGLINSLNSKKYREGICNLLDNGKRKDLDNPCIDCISMIQNKINMNL